MSMADLFRPALDPSLFPIEPEDPVANELSGLRCEARVRRAFSKLAAAQAAHRLNPGTYQHRESLETAAYHADIAASLDEKISSLESIHQVAAE